MLCSFEYVYATLAWRPREKRRSSTSFEGMVLTLASRHAAPLDVLVLRILSQRLRDVALEAGIWRLDSGRLRGRRVDIRLQHSGTERQHARAFMLASTPRVWKWWFRRLPWLPMYDMSSIMLQVSWRWYVTDQFWKRGKVNPFGVTAIGAVPLAKVGSMKGGCRPVRGKPIVQIERGRHAVGQVRGQQIGLEPERRLTDELPEGDP